MPKANKGRGSPLNGDHGTGTAAAIAGTTLRPIEGDNPNNVGVRRRLEAIDDPTLRLSLRQYQAAQEIRDAFCQVEMLSSGGPLKEQVDCSPKPDATIDVQCDAQSRFNRAMRKVPNGPARRIVEGICFDNVPHSRLPRRWGDARLQFKLCMTLVANHLQY